MLAASLATAQDAPREATPADITSARTLWDQIVAKVSARDWAGSWDLLSEEAKEEFMEELIPKKRQWRRAPGNEIEKDSGLPYAMLLSMSWRELWAAAVKAEIRQSKGALNPERWSFAGLTVTGFTGRLLLKDEAGSTDYLTVHKENGSWLVGNFYRVAALLLRDPETKGSALERRACASLKAISTGQEQFKNAVAVDINTNGVGEYGTLEELGGWKQCRGGGQTFSASSFIPAVLGQADERGIVVCRGYCFICYLPTGAAAATATGGDTDPVYNETSFIVYAWPAENTGQGQRELIIDVQGQPYTRLATHWGAADPPAWSEALEAPDWTKPIDESRWKPYDERETSERKRPDVAADPNLDVAKFEKIMKSAYEEFLEAFRNNEEAEVDFQKIMDEACKKNGYENATDFYTKAAMSLGADQMQQVVKKVTEWFTKEVQKIVEERAKKDGEGD